MSNTDKSYLVITPPKEDDPGKMVLIITRQTGGMFGGVGQTVFLIDELEHMGELAHAWLRGVRYVDDTRVVVVEFPAYVQYMLVVREQASFMSPVELAAQQKEDQDSLRKVDASTVEPVLDNPGGHPGQYL